MSENFKTLLGIVAFVAVLAFFAKMDYVAELETENQTLKIKAAQCQGSKVVFAESRDE
ncbi:hypothetical protein OYT1_ch1637 [Ferriphaselus amnicola]|uniref:Uncharacterized protein n=1 Tax=Ferriphaselus amnicola TaxID=1188319 RepID=A0A2Z6GCS8_9PROT|nr:hypothetical protein [Ferriphaselus amnicola]BBE51184.1 hypothetical protein OYT1_ch1637 [Ferriphaselus amnicola]